MDHTIKHITRNLISRLPEDDQYYRLKDLKEYDFPVFVIRRIRLELERNLAESIVPPETDWADMNSDRVKGAWDRFVDAIRAEARLPASYAKSVIEISVADILDILVQPLKNVPEVIFGSNNELSKEEVKKRSQAVVVYGHYPAILERYMERKEVNLLRREKCREVIRNADRRLTEHYTPLNWAQMLDPLFTLLEGKVDSSLFRLFFEDRKMARIARYFDLLDREVNRAGLIEILSSPDLLNMEGYEEDQSELFGKSANSGEEPKDSPAAGEESAEMGKSGETITGKSEKSEEIEEIPGDSFEEGSVDVDGEQEDIVESFHKTRDIRKKQQEEHDAGHNHNLEVKDSEEEVESINEQFIIEEVEEDHDIVEFEAEEAAPPDDILERIEKARIEDEEEEKAQEKSEIMTTLEDQKGSKSENKSPVGSQVDLNEGDEDIEDEREQEEKTEGEVENESENEETPMWKRFMSQDEIDQLEWDEEESIDTEDDYEDHEGFIEEPIFDLTGEQEGDNGNKSEDVERLENALEDEKQRFIKDIFRDSERAYDEAMIQIVEQSDWRSASKYIEQEIFKRNLIDMYSEVAVDFTDRLQNYFLEKSKS